MKLVKNEYELLPCWEPLAQALPRSRLYCLPPLGVGTPAVESLCSYLQRLAQAHGVSVRALLNYEVLPRLYTAAVPGTPVGVATAHDLAPRGNGWRLARQLHGLGCTAERAVAVLAELTGRRELSFLTLWTWRHVLPTRDLFAPCLRWCAACYAAQSAAGQPLHTPLLWQLAPVTARIKHACHLSERCPHCQQTAAWFTGTSRPGGCHACSNSLSSPPAAPVTPKLDVNETAWPWQQWINKQLGELLQVAPQLPVAPPRENVARSVTALLGSASTDERTRLSVVLGTRPQSWQKWAQGKACLRLDLLLKFCWHYELPLITFLTAPLAVPRIVVAVPATSPLPVQADKRAKGTRRETLRLAMESALQETPPPSLRAVAQRVQLAHRTLLYYEPELCHQIVQRRADEFTRQHKQWHAALLTALRTEPPPPLKQCAATTGVSANTLQYHFPDLCKQVIARAQDHQQQHRQVMGQTLQHALTEEPPPQVGILAQRLGCQGNTLRTHFPALCRQLTARHQQYQANARAERQAALLQNIEATAHALHEQGIFPSVNEVSAHLSPPRYIGNNETFVNALRNWRKAWGWSY